jgi:Domain of unknown function (DUF4388)/Inner membrane component of T3SS, cytoplasmic domain
VEPSFEGHLERVETPDLLTFVNLGRRTGLLEMERPNQSTRIFFAQGDPVFANSTREGLRLGDLLRRVGKVSPRDLERCASRPRGSGDRIGQALVAEGLLTEEELRSFLKIQVSEVIFDTFTWGEGRFGFYDDVTHPPNATTIDMNLQNLLMEGVRRLDERDRLADAFPDHDALVEALANPEWVKDKMSLTPEEWSVFFLVDGRRSIEEICLLAGNPDELATLEILNRLRGVKLIGLLAPQPRTESAMEMAAVALGTKEHSKAPEKPSGPESVASVPEPPARPVRTADSLSIVSPMAIQYAADRAPSARLVLEGVSPEASYPLQRDTYTLGRGPKNDIVLNDPNVSTFHARIERGAAGFTVVDLRSTNGTAVNMESLRGPTLLRPNDLLNLGPVQLRYLEG